MILLKKNDVETMTSEERVSGLHTALKKVFENNIDGDFVECGIYLGGNIIIAKKFFDSVNIKNKQFFCYDTFTGMTSPGIEDTHLAHKLWDNKAKCLAPMNAVIEQFNKHNILDERIVFIKGDVLETLKDKKNLPKKICILRLDTDWYESTLSELENLYHLLEPGGYLIIDDYGYWNGCKKAVDKFFGENFVNEKFIKLDNTGIMYQKP